MKKTPAKRGITFIEVILVVAIIALLTSGSFVIFSAFIMDTQLDATADEIVSRLRQANTNAHARLYDLTWGVYLNDASSEVTLFAGSSYASRNVQYDVANTLPTSIALQQIAFNGGGKEVIFKKITGDTTNYGSFKIQSQNGKERTITVNQIGQIENN